MTLQYLLIDVNGKFKLISSAYSAEGGRGNLAVRHSVPHTKLHWVAELNAVLSLLGSVWKLI